MTSKQYQKHIERLNFRGLRLRIQGSTELSVLSQRLSEVRFAALRNLDYEFDDMVPLLNPELSLRISEKDWQHAVLHLRARRGTC